MKTMRAMPSFNGVAAGSTATLILPISQTYHGLLLTYAGVTVAQMDEIRFVMNGRPVYVTSGTQLDTMNQYEGIAASAGGLLYIDFERIGLKTRGGVELTAIGTGYKQVLDSKAADFNPTPLSTFQMEIDINAGAAAPVLSAKAYQSGPSPLGVIRKRRRFIYSPTGAGDYEISDLPKGDLIDKIFIHWSANLTGVKLDRDNFRAFDRTLAENNLIQTDGVRVPQANLFVVDPSERGNGTEMLVSRVNDFRLICTMAGAGTLTIFVDYVGGLAGS